eukprot:Rmarinus@m.29402
MCISTANMLQWGMRYDTYHCRIAWQWVVGLSPGQRVSAVLKHGSDAYSTVPVIADEKDALFQGDVTRLMLVRPRKGRNPTAVVNGSLMSPNSPKRSEVGVEEKEDGATMAVGLKLLLSEDVEDEFSRKPFASFLGYAKLDLSSLCVEPGVQKDCRICVGSLEGRAVYVYLSVTCVYLAKHNDILEYDVASVEEFYQQQLSRERAVKGELEAEKRRLELELAKLQQSLQDTAIPRHPEKPGSSYHLRRQQHQSVSEAEGSTAELNSLAASQALRRQLFSAREERDSWKSRCSDMRREVEEAKGQREKAFALLKSSESHRQQLQARLTQLNTPAELDHRSRSPSMKRVVKSFVSSRKLRVKQKSSSSPALHETQGIRSPPRAAPALAHSLTAPATDGLLTEGHEFETHRDDPWTDGNMLTDMTCTFDHPRRPPPERRPSSTASVSHYDTARTGQASHYSSSHCCGGKCPSCSKKQKVTLKRIIIQAGMIHYLKRRIYRLDQTITMGLNNFLGEGISAESFQKAAAFLRKQNQRLMVLDRELREHESLMEKKRKELARLQRDLTRREVVVESLEQAVVKRERTCRKSERDVAREARLLRSRQTYLASLTRDLERERTISLRMLTVPPQDVFFRGLESALDAPKLVPKPLPRPKRQTVDRSSSPKSPHHHQSHTPQSPHTPTRTHWSPQHMNGHLSGDFKGSTDNPQSPSLMNGHVLVNPSSPLSPHLTNGNRHAHGAAAGKVEAQDGVDCVSVASPPLLGEHLGGVSPAADSPVAARRKMLDRLARHVLSEARLKRHSSSSGSTLSSPGGSPVPSSGLNESGSVYQLRKDCDDGPTAPPTVSKTFPSEILSAAASRSTEHDLEVPLGHPEGTTGTAFGSAVQEAPPRGSSVRDAFLLKSDRGYREASGVAPDGRPGGAERPSGRENGPSGDQPDGCNHGRGDVVSGEAPGSTAPHSDSSDNVLIAGSGTKRFQSPLFINTSSIDDDDISDSSAGTPRIVVMEGSQPQPSSPLSRPTRSYLPNTPTHGRREVVLHRSITPRGGDGRLHRSRAVERASFAPGHVVSPHSSGRGLVGSAPNVLDAASVNDAEPISPAPGGRILRRTLTSPRGEGPRLMGSYRSERKLHRERSGESGIGTSATSPRSVSSRSPSQCSPRSPRGYEGSTVAEETANGEGFGSWVVPESQLAFDEEKANENSSTGTRSPKRSSGKEHTDDVCDSEEEELHPTPANPTEEVELVKRAARRNRTLTQLHLASSPRRLFASVSPKSSVKKLHARRILDQHQNNGESENEKIKEPSSPALDPVEVSRASEKSRRRLALLLGRSP